MPLLLPGLPRGDRPRGDPRQTRATSTSCPTRAWPLLSAYAGLKSAALNVYVNAKGLEDRDFAQERLDELEGILAEGGP